MNKEQASEAYIKAKLRDSNEYLGCEESRRMTLIQSDMYTVQQAFEDGWDEANNTMIEKACQWIEKHIFDFPWYDNERGDFSSKDVANALRKAIEEQL